MFHFVNGVHECMSVSFAANLSFAEWSSAFNDRKMTAAPLDQLTHPLRVRYHSTG